MSEGGKPSTLSVNVSDVSNAVILCKKKPLGLQLAGGEISENPLRATQSPREGHQGAQLPALTGLELY